MSHRPGGKQNLLKLLMDQPHLAVAHYVAWEVEAERYYPAVPFLLRYALFDGDMECYSALESMGFPQAAWAILENSETTVEQSLITGNIDWRTEKIENETRGRLRSLCNLNSEPYPGQYREDWSSTLRSVAQGRHMPFPDAISDEADQLLLHFARCIDVEGPAFAFYKTRMPSPPGLFDPILVSGGTIKFVVDRITVWRKLWDSPPPPATCGIWRN